MGNLTYNNAEFLVTPMELMHSIRMMHQATEKAKREVERLQTLSDETDRAFEGKAKETFVSNGRKLLREWQELLDGLHNNVSDLQEIATAYEKAEGENVNVVLENDS